MVSDTTTLFPRADELRSRIEWSGSRPENIFVDAREVTATADLSEDQYDNIFLLGMAVQAGLLPLSPADIEWADRKSVVSGKRVSVRVALGGSRIIQQNK